MINYNLSYVKCKYNLYNVFQKVSLRAAALVSLALGLSGCIDGDNPLSMSQVEEQIEFCHNLGMESEVKVSLAEGAYKVICIDEELGIRWSAAQEIERLKEKE